MNKRRNVLFSALIVFLILGIIILYFFSKNIKDTQITQQEIEYFNETLNNGNIDECNNLINKELRDSCNSQLENRFSESFQPPSLSVCMSLDTKDQLEKDMCVLNFSLQQAKNNQDTTYCNEIQTEDVREGCFLQIQNLNF